MGPPPLVHIIRHGPALHNVDRSYPHRDPPLTDAGHEATKQIRIPAVLDLIVICPMTRTIQIALNAFPSTLGSTPFRAEVQIWPDLRETYDNAECNKGISRADILAKFPQFDFSECPEKWDHPPHTFEGATERAEAVQGVSKSFQKHIATLLSSRTGGSLNFLSREIDMTIAKRARIDLAPTMKRKRSQ